MSKQGIYLSLKETIKNEKMGENYEEAFRFNICAITYTQ